jgi:capsular exopolysaccharide synthesis family protein
LALAFGREALGSTIESADDAERSAAGIPVLGYALHTGRVRRHRLPRLVFRRIAPKRLTHRRRAPTPTVVTLTEPHSPGAEAYRALRTNIELVRPRGVVLVTSATDEDGKSTTTANLAVSLATAGSSVIVVDCDLRRARMHAFFGLSGSIGLTSVLLGRDTLDEALQSVPDVHGGSLRVLASGPLPPQPSELLGSSAVGKLMDTLRSKADYVLVDTPPVLAVSDPAVASRWADDVLMVVNVGWTTQHQLETALERLDQAAAPVLGLVLNNLTSPVRGGYYYYGRRTDEGDARPTVVAPEEWTRLVARPDVPNGTNGNGAKHYGEEVPDAAEEGDDAWRRLAGLRASLDEPHQPEKGDVETS